ncbi:porin family protein [Alkalimonas collagenimarina]|uniref:Porin family protein n=1 Tax=Alkalimonas collagenimarina TaxID=400390 RepID=A0ABT9H131_9GAMM|nr:porin family protein [Alkalimonas collagenimarina]MDP4537031.1 porin family protein [Alkalimonas collagenimarina]
MRQSAMLTMVFLGAGLFFTTAMASEPGSSHRVGANLFWGSTKVTDPEADQDFKVSDFNGYNLFYRYQWDPQYGVELAYRNGSMGIGSVASNIFTGELEDIDYSAISISGYAGYPITQQQQLYAKLGISQNRIAMQYRTRRFSETEFGVIGAVGWQYQFKNALGFQTEASYSSGKYFKSFGTVLFGLNYRF